MRIILTFTLSLLLFATSCTDKKAEIRKDLKEYYQSACAFEATVREHKAFIKHARANPSGKIEELQKELDERIKRMKAQGEKSEKLLKAVREKYKNDLPAFESIDKEFKKMTCNDL